jgi:hypothetical protein
MKCVERIYYDEQRSISQLSGNLPIEFIIAVQNSLEYIDLKRYVVTLSRFHSYCLLFPSILYFDKLWSVSRLIAMSWTSFNWGRLLVNVNKSFLFKLQRISIISSFNLSSTGSHKLIFNSYPWTMVNMLTINNRNIFVSFFFSSNMRWT